MKQIFSLVIYLFFIGLFGCGIKGDPKPPHKPPFIGRGEPSFQGAISSEELEKEKKLKKDKQK